MVQHFASLGHNCPSTANPADFALDMVSVDLREDRNEAVSREKVERLTRLFATTQELEKLAARDEAEAVELGLVRSEGREMTPMYIAMPILIRRGLLCFKRQPDMAIARIMQVVVVSTFIALFFAPLKTDYTSFQNRLGVIQQVLAREFFIYFPRDFGAHLGSVYFVGMLQNIGLYPLERDGFYGVCKKPYVGPLLCLLKRSAGILRRSVLCRLFLLRVPSSGDTIRDRLGPCVLPAAYRCELAAIHVDVLPQRSGFLLHS